ncbi:MAG: aminomethyl-transferring glycine dehydrogenase subunit GcvPA [Polyangiales bacterium]
MRFLPHTQAEITAMLQTIGVDSLDALFAPIPEGSRLNRPLAFEPALDEIGLMRHLTDLADRNQAQRGISFLGAGIYAHHVPPAVDQLLLRGEFMTAYTPYQAEVAQGTLQAIFEFQTIVCELFGLPVANASMYDGASAAAEAVLMARRITKKSRTILSDGLHPEYSSVIHTYLQGLTGTPAGASAPSASAKRRDLHLEGLDFSPLASDGRTDLSRLEASLRGGDVSAVVIGEPNFFGVVEDLRAIGELAHKHGALLISATPETVAMASIDSPGARGVDIAVGEGQPLGLPPQLGGPGVGLFACRDGREYLTNVPGRLVGETVDQRGKRGYVLTLATREQHIRRERATSNICTNHSLCALAVCIRLCILGKDGFTALGDQCHSRAEYLKGRIAELPSFEIPYRAPTFNEFVVRFKKGEASPLLAKLESQGVFAGVDLGRFFAPMKDRFLVAVTERHTRADLDRLVALLAGA